jgi:hypothetical protein
MLLSWLQKREILRIAVNVAADRVRTSTHREAKQVAVAIVEAAIAAQERLVEKDGGVTDRLILSLRKKRDGMIEV